VHGHPAKAQEPANETLANRRQRISANELQMTQPSNCVKSGIVNIWSYIADDNISAADRVEQAIYDAYVRCRRSLARPFPFHR
jgi:hypothetical protein